MKNVFNKIVQQEQCYFKTVIIILQVSAAVERTVHGEKINYIQKKVKVHIYTRNTSSTWIAKYRTNVIQINKEGCNYSELLQSIWNFTKNKLMRVFFCFKAVSWKYMTKKKNHEQNNNNKRLSSSLALSQQLYKGFASSKLFLILFYLSWY